jgi:hypothetical protein
MNPTAVSIALSITLVAGLIAIATFENAQAARTHVIRDPSDTITKGERGNLFKHEASALHKALQSEHKIIDGSHDILFPTGR